MNAFIALRAPVGSYLTAETLQEIDRIKLHRKAFGRERCIAVATSS